MKIKYNNSQRIEQEVNVSRGDLTIVLNEDVEFDISIEHGELIIRKNNFGKGNSSLSISPKVSNEIGLK